MVNCQICRLGRHEDRLASVGDTSVARVGGHSDLERAMEAQVLEVDGVGDVVDDRLVCV